MKVEHKFPKGFLWGSATSSYQVEGGILNNDWAYAALSQKVPDAGKACNHYELYKQDFDIAKSLHQNAHRLSLEWSRIEPIEGYFDEEAINHYINVLKDLREKNMYISLTLWHFTLPIWFSNKGGFESKENSVYFEKYAQYMIERFDDFVDDICIINEPEVYVSNGYIRGNWPPFKKTLTTHFVVLKNLADVHNAIYKKAKKKNPNIKIGVAKDNIDFEAIFILKPIARFLVWFWNERFLDMTEDCLDYIGLNYYFHKKLGVHPKGPYSDFGWSIYPRGIYTMLCDLKKYNLPVYVTENGIADAKDVQRGEFIQSHVREVYNALQSGVDVRGYFYWSLLDNFEWAAGYSQRFGLIEVNYDTMERKIRPSAYVYKFICEHNGF